MRKQSLLHTRQKHVRKLESLGVVHRKQHDRRAFIHLIGVAHQCGMVQKLRRTFTALDCFDGRINQLSEVLHSPLRFRRPVGLEHRLISAPLQNQVQQPIHRQRRFDDQVVDHSAENSQGGVSASAEGSAVKHFTQRPPHRRFTLERELLDRLNRALSDSARRSVDDPQQADRVVRILSHLKICQDVFHFSALVETDASRDHILSPVAPQRFLDLPGLKVRAIQDRNGLSRIVACNAIDHIRNVQGLVLSVPSLVETNS